MFEKVTCIIPAAGKSSRFKELGKAYPKGILPVNGDPIIIHNIRSLQKIGVCNFVIVSKESDVDIFLEILNLYQLESCVRIAIVDESNNSGPLTSLVSGWNITPIDHNVLVVLSDILLLEDYLLRLHDYLSDDEEFISYQLESDFKRFCLISTESYVDKPKTEEEALPYKIRLQGQDFYKAVSGIYYYLSKRMDLALEISSKNTKIETQFSDFFKHFISEIDTPLFPVGDFGTLEDYLRNRNITTTSSRVFNTVSAKGDMVVKSGDNPQKILSEYFFLDNIPSSLKPYFVRTYDIIDTISGDTHLPSYTMELIRGNNLRERLLLLGMENSEFSEFLSDFNRFNLKCASTRTYEGFDIVKFTDSKLMERTRNLDDDIDLHHVYRWSYKFSTHILSNLIGSYSGSSFMHGDCVLSNIFYNDGILKLVDPNGMWIGSHIYDWAKLYQSIILDYDYIDMGFYFFNDDGELTILSKGMETNKKIFMNFLEMRFLPDEIFLIRCIAVVLLGSLIPLHSDKKNNQIAFGILFREQVREILNEKGISI